MRRQPDLETDKKDLILTKAAAFSAALSIIGLHFSPALASIGLGLFLIPALLMNLRNGWHRIPAWAWILPVLAGLQALVQFVHGQQEGWEQKIMLRLPLLAFPLVISVWRNQRINSAFITAMALVHCWLAGASVLNYAAHFRFLNQMVLESKPLPLFSQVYHIEFSIMLAVFSLSGLFELVRRGSEIRVNLWLQLLFAATVLNVIFLHVLSVRSGMLAFWAGAVAGLWLTGPIGGRKLVRIIILIVAMLISVAVLTPSIRNRVVNTLDDLRTVRTGGDVNDKSFGRRWEAWKTGLEVVKNRPLAGVGLCGVEAALQAQFNATGSSLHPTNRIMPHNQWLDFTLQSGIPAGILYLLFFIMAGFRALRERLPFFAGVLFAIMLSGMFESLLERQAGVITALVGLTLSAMHREYEKNERFFRKSN